MLNKDIICVEEYVHSYPYDWRSKTPVIVKSSHQWFIDVQRFKNQAMVNISILCFATFFCPPSPQKKSCNKNVKFIFRRMN